MRTLRVSGDGITAQRAVPRQTAASTRVVACGRGDDVAGAAADMAVGASGSFLVMATAGALGLVGCHAAFNCPNRDVRRNMKRWPLADSTRFDWLQIQKPFDVLTLRHAPLMLNFWIVKIWRFVHVADWEFTEEE